VNRLQGVRADLVRTSAVFSYRHPAGTWKSGWQFSGTQGLDEAYVPFFGAFGADSDEAMVAVANGCL
jgi:hypothetical protein